MTDRELFVAALEQPDPAAQLAFLTQHGVDAEQLRRVEILLQAHAQASRFLAAPAMERSPTPHDPTRTAHDAAADVAPNSQDVLALLTPAEKPDQLGMLDHYEVLQVVGRGGMGVVLKAFDPKLHRLVAIKVMSPHLAANAAARKRFEREARAVAAVRNEHVVAIYAVEVERETPYLVMEFVGGVSLQDRMEQRGPLETKEILRIGMQAARGLAAAHAHGLVHRDVKPANILLENSVERVKITDFGLARAADDANLTQSGVISGTPNYMSPEQAAGAKIDARADLFSLGSVLYALSTGHPPFRADTPLAVLRRVCDDAPRPVRDSNVDIPEWLDAIIRKLLAKDPAQRFPSATEVADLLGQYLAHLQQPHATPMPAAIELPDGTTPAPVWTQIFAAKERRQRLTQLGLATGGAALFAGSLLLLAVEGLPVLAGLLCALIGISLVATMGFVKQHWDVPYKGRTLRFENNPFRGERLLIDGVEIARGGLGRVKELNGFIPDGNGAGDRIQAVADAGVFHFGCRILASAGPGQPHTPASPPQPAHDRWTKRVLVSGFAVLGLGLLWIIGTSLFDKFPQRDEQKANALFMLIIGWSSVLTALFVPGVIWARLRFRARHPHSERRRTPIAILSGIGLSLMVLSIVVAISRLPHLHYFLFGSRNVARLEIRSRDDFVDVIAIEHMGRRTHLFESRPSWLTLYLDPGSYTIVAKSGGREVYREEVSLHGREERFVSIFDDSKANAGDGSIRVACSDLGVTVKLIGPNQTIAMNTPGRSTLYQQQLHGGENYRLAIMRGQQVLHAEDVRVLGRQRYEVVIHNIVLPEGQVQLKPQSGSFPSDVTAMQFSPDRSHVAVSRLDGPILVFDAATGVERYRLERPKSSNTAVAIAPVGKQIAFVAPALKAPNVDVVHIAGTTVGTTELRPGTNELMNARALAFSNDGRRLAVSSAYNSSNNLWKSRIHRWQLNAKGEWQTLPALTGQEGLVEAMCFSADSSEVLAVSGTPGTALAWNWDTGEQARKIEAAAELNVVRSSKDLDLVAGWDDKKRLPELWYWRRGKDISNVPTPNPIGSAPIACLAISQDNAYVAAGVKGVGSAPWPQRASIRLWGLARGAVKESVLLGHTDWVMDVAFSDKNSTIISASRDGTICHWRAP